MSGFMRPRNQFFDVSKWDEFVNASEETQARLRFHILSEMPRHSVEPVRKSKSLFDWIRKLLGRAVSHPLEELTLASGYGVKVNKIHKAGLPALRVFAPEGMIVTRSGIAKAYGISLDGELILADELEVTAVLASSISESERCNVSDFDISVRLFMTHSL